MLPEKTNNQGGFEEFAGFVLNRFHAALSEDALNGFRVYLNELTEWNRKFNLVSVRSEEEVIFRHFADSLSGAGALELHKNANLSIIDIGTGAGLPGLAVKIAYPAVKLTLVESIQKKCSFLEHMKERLNLTGLTIINERAEVLGQDSAHRQAYDAALSRAVAKLSPNLEFIIPFIKIGGKALIYKTEKSVPQGEELDAMRKTALSLGASYAGSFSYTLPHEENTYSIIVFNKESGTPPQYPRRTGVPEKKPL